MGEVCLNCGGSFIKNSRQKNQRYCSKGKCQRKRKSLWQKQKMETDPAYKFNQKKSWERWAENHHGYWKEYRQRHPEKAERNRLMQVMRGRKRKSKPSSIAKMDASETRKIEPFGQYYLLPVIAKMDALKINMYVISSG